MDAFLTGALAGYGIAIPVGAIAILIVETGIRRGLLPAFVAGAGAATADLLYSALAVIGGAALASTVGGLDRPIRLVSALVLVVIAATGLRRARRSGESRPEEMPGDRRHLLRTYARFVGLTVINPTTVVYFAAVIIGLGVTDDLTPAQGALFALGAFLASLSWQAALAGVGAFAGHRLSERARIVAVVAGNLVILAFAVAIVV